MYGNQKLYSNKETIQCPVCKWVLGSRYPEEMFSEHCDECKAIFTWHPYEYIPTVEMDSKPSKKCTCESCKYRDKK